MGRTLTSIDHNARVDLQKVSNEMIVCKKRCAHVVLHQLVVVVNLQRREAFVMTMMDTIQSNPLAPTIHQRLLDLSLIGMVLERIRVQGVDSHGSLWLKMSERVSETQTLSHTLKP